MKYQVSNTPDGLKFASCFVGCELAPDVIGRAFPLVAVNAEGDIGFLTKQIEDDFGEDKDFFYLNTKITIDLSTQQPCIYACMREGLKVEVEYEDFSEIKTLKDVFDFGDDIEFVGLLLRCDIKSIKILDTDSMEGVEIEL